MTRMIYAITGLFLLSGITFLFGHKPASKIQEKEEAITSLDLSQTTDKDRKHGKLFPRYKTGKKLTSQAVLEKGSRIDLLSNEIEVKKYPPAIDVERERKCPSYPKPGLVGLAYAADVIIAGAIQDKITSQFTEDEDFLYSEYSVKVDSVIKDNHGSPIEQNSTIQVIRPGGRVKFNGRIITATVPPFRPFIQGDRYILFLKFIPETKSYQAFSNGSFSIIDDQIKAPGNQRTGPTQQAFVDEIREALRTDLCQNAILN